MRKHKHCWSRRKRRQGRVGAIAIVNNTARAGSLSGLIPINIQVPINLGDANAFNRSNGSSAINIL